MNKIDEAWQALKALPQAEQERLAEVILEAATQPGDLKLSDAQIAEIERRRNDPNAQFLSLEEFRERVGKLGR